MKLSATTTSILKNFSNINPSIAIKPGSQLRTMATARSILATAVVEETFETPFAIYDLPKFISVISLFEEPDLAFGKNQVKISSGKQSVSYTYCDPTMIITPPEKEINFPAGTTEFDLSPEEFTKLVRAASIMQMSSIALTGNGHDIRIRALNPDNPTSDIYDIVVGETSKTFNMIMDADTIKLIPKQFKVNISPRGIVRFLSDDSSLLYYIVTNAKSNPGDL